MMKGLMINSVKHMLKYIIQFSIDETIPKYDIDNIMAFVKPSLNQKTQKIL